MASPTLLSYARDVQGTPANCPSFPVNIWTASMVPGTSTSITIPGNPKQYTYIMYVRVQPTGWCWVSRTGTASVPVGDTLQPSSSELIDGTIEYRRQVFSGDVLSFITSNSTCDIEVCLYSNGFLLSN